MCNNTFARFFEEVSSHSKTQDATQSLLGQAAILRDLLIGGLFVDWEAMSDVESIDSLYGNEVGMLPNKNHVSVTGNVLLWYTHIPSFILQMTDWSEHKSLKLCSSLNDSLASLRNIFWELQFWWCLYVKRGRWESMRCEPFVDFDGASSNYGRQLRDFSRRLWFHRRVPKFNGFIQIR